MSIQKIKDALALLEALSGDEKATQAEPRPVVVWTEYRGVIFGYTTDPTARPITLTSARMCLYWDKATGGVFGLCESGPTDGCQISATLPSADFEKVTGVASVTDAAVAAWVSAPVQGRD